jgi:hypothetical protein
VETPNDIEDTEQDGLTVSFDEETCTITFDWNDETHPEYNFLHLLTPEQLSKMLMDQIKQSLPTDEERAIQDG